MSRNIKRYLGLEEHQDQLDPALVEIPDSVPVTDAELYEADAIIDENTELQETVIDDIETSAVAIEEMEDHIDNIHDMLIVMNHGLESGDFSPQFAASVHIAAEKYSKLFSEKSSGVSVETYSHDKLDEFYRVSAEDFNKKAWELTNAVNRASSAPANALVTAAVVSSRKNHASALIKKADALLAKLKDAKASGSVDVDLKGLRTRLSVNGVVPKSAKEVYVGDQRSVMEVMEKYAPDAFSFNDTLSTKLEKVVADARNGDDVTDALQSIAKLQAPEDKLSKGILDGTQLMGNVKLLLTEQDLESKTTAGAFKEHSNRAVPKYVQISKGEPTGATTFSMSVSEIEELIRAIKVYASIIDKANSSITAKAKTLRTDSANSSRYVSGKGTLIKGGGLFVEPEFKAAGRYIKKYPAIFLGMISNTFGHSYRSADTLVQLATRAVAAANKAS